VNGWYHRIDLGNRMSKQVKVQFKRIVDSIQRLTTGTPLERATVWRRISRDRERVAFRVASSTGSPLFACYQGILLLELKSWTDESLDQRLYESFDPLVGRLLNDPKDPKNVNPGVGAQKNDQDECVLLAPQIGEQINDRPKGCQVCRTILADMRAGLIGLSNIKQRGSAISGERSGDSLREFTHLLSCHLQMQDELARLRAALKIHRQSHRLPM
jgi:hypothetical protein